MLTSDLFKRRMNDLQQRITAAGMDGAVILSPANVYYTSGFRHYVRIRLHGVIVPASGDVTFITPKIEYEYAVKSSWIDDVRYYVEFPEPNRHRHPLDLLAEVLAEKGLLDKKLGIERHHVSLEQFAGLQAKFPQVQWDDVSPILADMRLIKSPEEIELLRMAGRVAITEWEAALKAAAVGVPEYEVAMAARDAGIRFVAEHFDEEADSYLSPMLNGTQIMIASERSSIPHGRASIRRLRANDVVMMCFCMVNMFKGYRIGFTRHFSLGQPTERQKEIYKIVLEAQEAALDAVKPGVPASYIDEVAREYLAKYDLVQYLTHRTGRGVGLDVAEAPELKEGDDTILQPGMTFSVEPAVYIPEYFGVQIEDSVVVTETGWEDLTPCPKDLVIL